MKVPIIILIILLSFERGIQGTAPVLKDGSLYVFDQASTKVFDTDLQFGQARLQFDQPLYINDILQCPYQENSDCAAQPAPGCPSCDFSLKATCKRGFERAGCCSNETEWQLWCDNIDNVEPVGLNAGDGAKYTVLAGQQQEFRWYVSPGEACLPIFVSLRLERGAVAMFASVFTPSPNADSYEWTRDTQWGAGMAYFEICPIWEDSLYRLGTYALTVEATYDSIFSLEVIVLTPQPSINSPAADHCSAIPSEYLPADTTDLTCLQDGETYDAIFPDAQRLPLVLPVLPGCHLSGLYVSGHPSTPTMDADLYCLTTVGSFDAVSSLNSIVARYLVGSDHLTFATCATEVTYIRCFVDILAAGRLAVVWSSGGVTRRYPFSASTTSSSLPPSTNLTLSPYDLTLSTGLTAARLVQFGQLSDTSVINYACATWDGSCFTDWLTSPTSEPLSLWPLPSWILDSKAFLQLAPPEPLQQLDPDPVDGLVVVTLSFNEVSISEVWQTASIMFIRITNADGETVQLPNDGPIPDPSEFNLGLFPNIAVRSLKRVNIPDLCSASHYADIYRVGSDTVTRLSQTSTETATSVTLSLEYDLNLVSTTTPALACLQKAIDLLSLSSVNRTELVEICPYNQTDPQWQEDPCCNIHSIPIGCCLPTEQSTLVPYYEMINDTTLQSFCAHPECATVYWGQFQDSINSISTVCSFALWVKETNFRVQEYLELRVASCRLEVGMGINFQGVPCTADADCQQLTGSTGSCRTDQGICELLPLSDIEDRYLTCYINKMDSFTEEWIRTNVLSGSAAVAPRNSSRFYDGLKSAAQEGDCVGTSFFQQDLRSHFYLDPSSAGTTCLTTTCQAPTNNDWCPECSIPEWLWSPSSEEVCASSPSLCNIADPAPCPPDNSASYYCVFCPEPTAADPYPQCIPNLAVTSETQCNATIACVLPDGTVLFNTSSEAECAALQGSCSADCIGPSCRSYRHYPGVCYFPSADSETICSNTFAEATWYLNAVCLVEHAIIVSAIECAVTGGVWYTCESDSLACASSPSFTELDSYLQCFDDQWRACRNQQECANSGLCSDRSLLQFAIVDNQTQAYAIQTGGCFTSGFYDLWTLEETSWCQSFEDLDRTTNGCRNNAISSAAACPSGIIYDSFQEVYSWQTWLQPAQTEAQCLAPTRGRVGCRQPEIFQSELRYQWITNEQECSGCLGFFGNIFEWSPGVWQAPQAKPMLWKQQIASSPLSWSATALSFAVTEDWAITSQRTKLSFPAASQAICRFKLIASPLLPLTCDCLDSSVTQTDNCYRNSDAAVTVAIGALCADDSTFISTSEVKIWADNESVSSGCTEVVFSLISSSFFQPLPPTASVSFDVAQREKQGETSFVQNQNGASVGELAGDGLLLEERPAGDLQHLQLCLAFHPRANASNPKYNVRDVGYYDGQFIYPLGLTNLTFLGFTINEDEEWCFRVTVAQHVDDRNTGYFPIYRLDNYQTQTVSYYSTTSLALVYTLGALFCVDLFFTLFYLVSAIYSYVKNGQTSLANFAVALMACLCIFRIVYLFALESQVIYEQILANFVVFELPTFLYFSSVSFLLGAYLAIGATKGIPKKQSNLQWVALIAINVIVWCLFVASVIAVAVLNGQGTTSPSVCPGILPPVENNTNQQLYDLRLAYQSIIIALCGILCIGFGMSLVLLINKTQGDSFWAKTKRSFTSRGGRTYRTATIISMAYLLRCILFVIILAGDFTSSVYMFITLLITEVIPIFLVVVHFRLVSEPFHRFTTSTVSSATRSRSRGSVGSGSRDSSHASHSQAP